MKHPADQSTMTVINAKDRVIVQKTQSLITVTLYITEMGLSGFISIELSNSRRISAEC